MSQTHICNSCSKEPEYCFCQRCLDDMKDDAFEDGKKEGYEEGHRDGVEEGVDSVKENN